MAPPRKISDEQIARLVELHQTGMKREDIAVEVGVPLSQVHYYLGKLCPTALTPKQQELKEQMLRLRDEGLNNIAIAATLDIGILTVRKYIGKQPKEFYGNQNIPATCLVTNKPNGVHNDDTLTTAEEPTTIEAVTPPPPPKVKSRVVTTRARYEVDGVSLWVDYIDNTIRLESGITFAQLPMLLELLHDVAKRKEQT